MSQASGRFKQNPGNNCQKNGIGTKNFVQYFSGHPVNGLDILLLYRNARY